MATEQELREKIATWGNAYLGITEGSSAHKELINIFNNSGLCTRYKMTTSDAWCAMFVSDAFIACNLTSIFPCVECYCPSQITMAKNAGIWVEDDAYTPKVGDVIMYDWDDSGSGDCTGTADHVGIVQSISGSSFTVIEGNKSDTVGIRNMTVNGRYIRGYITPNYASAADGATDSGTTSGTTGGEMTTTADPDKVWSFLMEFINNAYGVAGLMGNLYAESLLIAINLQNSFESKLGYTDESYTKAVDNGTYTKFTSDSAGYGLAQWTYSSRKKALKAYCDNLNASIGNLDAQLGYLKQELQNDFPSLLSTLKSATSVTSASTAVLTKFEQPADQGSSVQATRASYGQSYYDTYASGSSSTGGTTDGGDKTIDELAAEVYAGKWGNDPERTERLTAAGYDAKAVQARVMELYYPSSTSTTKDENGVCYANNHEDGYSSGKTYKVTATSGLNMRYGPSTSYGIMKAMPYKTVVYYYGYYDKDSAGDKWKLVISGGITGWVNSKYLG